jgi:tetratricopeptide (TPR) repeat protein
MKHLVFLFMALAALLQGTAVHAQKKTFVRDYTYQAGEADSKLTARANATTQMRNILLSEVGQYLHVERTLKQDDTSEEFSQKIEAITAGIVEMKTLDEQWDGATYYIKAEMAVDPKDLERRIAEVLNDKQKTQELEEARKRTLAAEAENARLRKELEATKNEQQRLTLQTKYQQTADALSAEEYFTKGNNARENRFYELSIEYFQKAIELDPNHAEAYYNMGNAYYRMGVDTNSELENNNKAIRCYERAIDIDPSHAKAYFSIGQTYSLMDNGYKAIWYFKKVIELDPNYARAYLWMGMDYNTMKEYDNAIQCFQKAIDIDPTLSLAYNEMGNVYYDLKNYIEAIRCCQKAIDIDPSNPYAYYLMGKVYYNGLRKKKEGIKNYQQAARLGHFYAKEILRGMGKTW